MSNSIISVLPGSTLEHSDHLVIYEPNADGHHMNFVRWIVDALAASDFPRITLLTSAASIEHPSLLTLVCNSDHRVSVRAVDADSNTKIPDSETRVAGIWRKLRVKLGQYRLFRKAMLELHAEDPIGFVLLPYLDYFLHVLSLISFPLPQVPWAGIAVRTRFHMSSMGIAPNWHFDAIERWVYGRLIRDQQLKAIFTVDPFFRDYARRENPAIGEKLVLLHEPVCMTNNETKASSRIALGIPTDQVVVLVYGSLSHRKGIDLLFAALERTSLVGEVTVSLIGRQSPEVTRLLSRPIGLKMLKSETLIQINTFVSAEQEEQAFRSADIVWLGYRSFLISSGVQAQAGFVGLPVISPALGLLGRLTKDQGLGEAVDLDDLAALDAALVKLVGDRELRQKMGQNGRAYFSEHSTIAFGNKVAQIILNAMRLRTVT